MVILLWIIRPFQEVFTMARKSYTTEQIIGLLRQAEVSGAARSRFFGRLDQARRMGTHVLNF